MIRLEVADYCVNCPAFEPKISKWTENVTPEEKHNNTTVTCTHAKWCKNMIKYLASVSK